MGRSGNLRHVLVIRPSEFTYWTEKFVVACQLLVDGNRDEALETFSEYNGLAVTHWYHFVAQNAGRDRLKLLGKSHQQLDSLPVEQRASARMPVAEISQIVFERDHFRCRFCRGPVLPPETLKKVSQNLGIDLSKKSTNLETHGAHWLHCATIDHIVSHAAGGSSEPENLATSCKSCQYGKGKYSLEELELELRGPAPDLRVKHRSWFETVTALTRQNN